MACNHNTHTQESKPDSVLVEGGDGHDDVIERKVAQHNGRQNDVENSKKKEAVPGISTCYHQDAL
jgi:hypothetical protein